MIRCTGVGILLSMATLTACGVGDRAGSGWSGTVDTLANGAVVVRNPADGLWGEGDAWRIRKDLRIGAVDGGGPAMFGSVFDLAVDELGRIYVLDRQANEIRVFDADGEFVRSIGRQGSGPGEFNRPLGLSWGPEGHLWVTDWRNARYAVFDTSGAFVGSILREIPGISVAWSGVFDRAGRFYDYGSLLIGGERQSRVLRFVVDANMTTLPEPVDTFPLPESDDAEAATFRFSYSRNGRSVVSLAPVPFAPRLRTHFDRRGSIWIGSGRQYRIYQRALDGDTVRIIERVHEPLPVTEGDFDRARADLQRYIDMGAAIDWSRIPEVKPAFNGLITDSDGYLWVRPVVADTSGGTPYDIFDPEGLYLGRVRLPVDIDNQPQIRGGFIYGTTEDALGVTYVVRLSIEGRGE